jgi:hypothetical protein
MTSSSRKLNSYKLAIPNDNVRMFLGCSSLEFGYINIVLEKVPSDGAVLLQNYFDYSAYPGKIIYYLDENTTSGNALTYIRPDLPSIKTHNRMLCANGIFPATNGMKKLAENIAAAFGIAKPDYLTIKGEKFDLKN